MFRPVGVHVDAWIEGDGRLGSDELKVGGWKRRSVRFGVGAASNRRLAAGVVCALDSWCDGASFLE